MYLHRSGKVSSAVTISQYHSLSYGKIEKLPEVENKTQQCDSFNTKKTKLQVKKNPDIQVYVFYHDTISIQIEEEKKHLHKNKHIFFILAHLMLQLKYSHTKQL